MTDSSGDSRWLHDLNPSLACSSNLAALYSDQLEAIDHFIFTMFLATRSDEVSFIAKNALDDYYNSEAIDPKETRSLKEGFEIKNGPNYIALKEFRRLTNTMLATRTVDTFLWYVASAILECLKSKPELLASKESVTIEQILSAGGWDALLVNLAERKVNELSYKGLTGIEEYISRFISVELFPDKQEQSLVRLAVEFRNISAHNRGIVNTTFLRRISDSDRDKFTLGERVEFGLTKVIQLSLTLSKAAKRLDDAIAVKFGVPQKRLDAFLSESEAVRLYRVAEVMRKET